MRCGFSDAVHNNQLTGTPKGCNLTTLKKAFNHKADGSGVFESGQHPIIVGQAEYNKAYGTTFAAKSYCNGTSSGLNVRDGFARINVQGGTTFGFNILLALKAKMGITLPPKAIHDVIV